MNPFIRKVKSQEEKDALLAAARVEWDKLGEFNHLVASSEEVYLSKIADSIIVERTPFTSARELSADELAKQNGALMFSQIFGTRADDKYSSIPAFAEMQKAQERRDLEKLLGPARRAETWLETLVREAINKVQSVPRRASERTGIIPRAAAASQGDNSDVARFLRAYVENDTATQREIARSLAAA